MADETLEHEDYTKMTVGRDKLVLVAGKGWGFDRGLLAGTDLWWRCRISVIITTPFAALAARRIHRPIRPWLYETIISNFA